VINFNLIIKLEIFNSFQILVHYFNYHFFFCVCVYILSIFLLLNILLGLQTSGVVKIFFEEGQYKSITINTTTTVQDICAMIWKYTKGICQLRDHEV
jgi:hypothetical protein